MRCLVLLLVAALCAASGSVAGAENSAALGAASGDTLDIDCADLTERFMQPSAPGATAACSRPETQDLPVFAVGEFITVILKTTPDCSALSMYLLLIDGMSSGIGNSGCDSEQKALGFRLSLAPRAQNNWPVDREAVRLLWQRLLHNPWEAQDGLRHARISVQRWTRQGAGPATQQLPFVLKIIDFQTLRALVVLIPLAALGLAFILLRSGGLLRDRGRLAEGVTPGSQSFSLARVQMAWWFGLVFASYAFLWLVCAELPMLSNSTMILLGIAGATGMAGTAVDAPQRVLKRSENWLMDITSDEQGVTLYRLQHVIWTMFFGLTFVVQVLSNLAMPEFDMSTLGLMGISAAAYVGFKMPEARAAADRSPAADPPAAHDPKAAYGPGP